MVQHKLSILLLFKNDPNKKQKKLKKKSRHEIRESRRENDSQWNGFSEVKNIIKEEKEMMMKTRQFE